MRRFWGFYKNESYCVGCNGATVYIYDKDENEIARFKNIPYAYTAAFMPGRNIISVKSTEGFLAFYDLDSLSLLKKITVTRDGAQDEGFAFTPDGKFFYNIEKPFSSTRTQLGIYETKTFTKVATLFAEDKNMVLDCLEFDNETNICYVMGFMRADNGVFDYGFVAIFDKESQTIQNIRAIEEGKYNYLHEYKHWEASGFTERQLQWCSFNRNKNIEKTSIKEVYEGAEKRI